ncbi:MAG TPA: MmgE/PrpD family protein [Burkholderiales bacterium]|nr:MmgE/PrpD family protein [Burkholderiales bacterium]
MTTPAQVLGKFSADLRFSDIPPAAVERAKDCIIDTVGDATYGARMPWSRMVVNYATRYGSGGPCSIFGFEQRVHAPYAALANGVLAHAYEQDSVRDPGVGAHPGAALLPAVLAAAEETRCDGKKAITAFVAGCEVMFRIAHATHHSPEKLGFHAPGLSGPYGAAVAAGKIFGLDAQQSAHALGIAGSLSSGLLAFTKSQEGAMVKRLHLGRASESGILAARLAAEGYTGPETILEGKFGYLDAYCIDSECEPKLLTEGLGSTWETLRICMKRYACHINAHTPVQATRELMAEHRISGGDVASVIIEGGERLLSHHNIVEPTDIMQAQYSVPFCVALALHRDPEDPDSFSTSAMEDGAIRAACRNIALKVRDQSGHTARSACVTVRLKDGRQFSRNCETYKGMPADPFTRADLRRKLGLLAGKAYGDGTAALFERLENIESAQEFALR